MPYFTIVELYVNRCCRKRRNYAGDIRDVKNDDRDETRGKDIPEEEEQEAEAADVTTVKQDVKEKTYRR